MHVLFDSFAHILIYIYLQLFQHLQFVSVHLQTYMQRKSKQMPQQMQTNSTTNANKCHNKYTHATTNANKCRALRQKMHQTYVKLNVVTYVCFYIYWGPDPSRVVLLDQVNV